MGTCITVFGIPVLEDRECRDKRLRRKNERKEGKHDSREERDRIKWGGKVDKAGLKAAGDVGVASYGIDPSGSGDALLGALGAGLGGYLGGGSVAPSAPLIDSNTAVLIGGAAIAAAVAWKVLL